MANEEANEIALLNQYRHFRLSSSSLTNDCKFIGLFQLYLDLSDFNAYATTWASIVGKVLIEKVRALIGSTLTPESVGPLKRLWLDNITQPLIQSEFESIKVIKF
jgi:hypothetical protein